MLQFPVALGQAVCRGEDPETVGHLVGFVLTPAMLALVRWGEDSGPSSFEPIEGLVAVRWGLEQAGWTAKGASMR